MATVAACWFRVFGDCGTSAHELIWGRGCLYYLVVRKDRRGGWGGRLLKGESSSALSNYVMLQKRRIGCHNGGTSFSAVEARQSVHWAGSRAQVPPQRSINVILSIFKVHVGPIETDRLQETSECHQNLIPIVRNLFQDCLDIYTRVLVKSPPFFIFFRNFLSFLNLWQFSYCWTQCQAS